MCSSLNIFFSWTVINVQMKSFHIHHYSHILGTWALLPSIWDVVWMLYYLLGGLKWQLQNYKVLLDKYGQQGEELHCFSFMTLCQFSRIHSSFHQSNASSVTTYLSLCGICLDKNILKKKMYLTQVWPIKQKKGMDSELQSGRARRLTVFKGLNVMCSN